MDKGILSVVRIELEWWGNYPRKLRVTSGVFGGTLESTAKLFADDYNL